jgi:hypothetical protein
VLVKTSHFVTVGHFTNTISCRKLSISLENISEMCIIVVIRLSAVHYRIKSCIVLSLRHHLIISSDHLIKLIPANKLNTSRLVFRISCFVFRILYSVFQKTYHFSFSLIVLSLGHHLIISSDHLINVIPANKLNTSRLVFRVSCFVFRISENVSFLFLSKTV